MDNKKDFAKVFMIAGSEPLGCCGIQADIKAVSACGGFAAGATTLLVDMNTTHVKGIHTIPVDIILSQSRDFLDDVGADCIKTGMLYEKQIVEAVAGLLREYPDVPKVIDPVMVATSGSALMVEGAGKALVEELFPLGRILTPNIPEAEALSGTEIKDSQDMEEAARIISSFTGGAVLVKGGHLTDRADDLLYEQGKSTWLSGERVENPNTHGTGCTLSSAIACGLAAGKSLEDSVREAKTYITGALKAGLNLGQGSGPLNHMYAL